MTVLVRVVRRLGETSGSFTGWEVQRVFAHAALDSVQLYAVHLRG